MNNLGYPRTRYAQNKPLFAEFTEKANLLLVSTILKMERNFFIGIVLVFFVFSTFLKLFLKVF